MPRRSSAGSVAARSSARTAVFRSSSIGPVAGRAGRGERTGEAIVQTMYPEHYSIQLACRQDYAAFFDRELTYRRGLRYPPLVALVNAVVRGRTFDEAMATAREIVGRLEPA